ncbi:uncharacterized protein LTR77_007362 [Saxophila tyrrhenica]|uniref:Ankyrin repeat domain-containing protein n=1 Tax=Saxophila tyrrhenica TaxID=1690608 RepID=A0AAV9P4H7_9PEZI|nr:hypothetical protein LTR77_007362 [Saxophila tyrrhenica]
MVAVETAPLKVIDLHMQHSASIAQGDALNHAVWRKSNDRLELMQYLLDRGGRAAINKIRIDFYMVERYAGCSTPVHDAALVGDVELAKLLVANSADVHIKNSHGGTPLEQVREPLEHMPDPLERVRGRGHRDVAEYLERLENRRASQL